MPAHNIFSAGNLDSEKKVLVFFYEIVTNDDWIYFHTWERRRKRNALRPTAVPIL